MEQRRVDARRNYDQLLTVARQAFAEQGTDASLRDIARRAGVGIGTLYRHFPTREALLEALLSNAFDELRTRAEHLATAEPPRAALLTWLGEVATGSTTYRGLPASVLAALHDETSPLHESCAAMRAAGAELLRQAQHAGEVREDVTMDELLALAAGIAWAGEQAPGQGLTERLLSLASNGFTAHE